MTTQSEPTTPLPPSTPIQFNSSVEFAIINPGSCQTAETAEALSIVPCDPHFAYHGPLRVDSSGGGFFCANCGEPVTMGHVCPVPPQGYELTGEYRLMKRYEPYIARTPGCEDMPAIAMADHDAGKPPRHILRKIPEPVAAASAKAEPVEAKDRAGFQNRTKEWLLACFGEEIASDPIERNHRFLEESLELVQACGCTKSEAAQLVEYVYSRKVGEKIQEVGGVILTLAALCSAQNIDMESCGEMELTRVWGNINKIRDKHRTRDGVRYDFVNVGNEMRC